MSDTVLIIEDEVTLARNIGVYLERSGYDTVVANDGTTGLRAHQTHQPEFLILDLRLPDIDGMDILSRLRREKSPTKVIIMTAHGGAEVEQQVMRSGADGYLTKPVMLSAIKGLIERLK